ncbi:hypothetical protein AVEN_143380-1 [Araneus ventricosus]|uniref:Uncharacterized protein n=1 Tax=Araneus ventricosus TaxID=182803 RepID=A0A4Y2AE15_ARAVE|nr:hypothetical protein AVEN_143380-1 [Araneus ventricosus]
MSDLQEFFSNYRSESDEEINKTNVRKRKGQRKRIWIKSKEFETAELAINYVDNFKTWKKITTYNSSAGCKVTYRCTTGEYRKNECPAGIYFLFYSENSVVSLYEAQNEHSNQVDGNRGLPMVAREMVRQLFEDGIRKPNAMLAAFQNRGLKEPEILKLKNFLAKVRQEKFGLPTISVKDVFNWCNARMDVPVEEDTPFCVRCKCRS